MTTAYQRKHLRAPCYTQVLYATDEYIFKAETLNISEGGMLLKALPHFPSDDVVPAMVLIPQYPPFINYSLEKLREYSQDLFPAKVIRVKAKMVRRLGETTNVDEIFKARIGIQFVEVDAEAKKIIADYVSIFAANVVHLQTLLETVNSSEESLEKSRLLSLILGYNPEEKISVLKTRVYHDYKSLQWL